VALDAQNNSYITGSFFGTQSFGPTTLKDSAGDNGYFTYDGFVAKYAADGSPVWAKSLGTGDPNVLPLPGTYPSSIAADPNGNTYVAGRFYGTEQFGSFTLTSSSEDAFVAKLDPSGNVTWVSQFGGTGQDIAYGVTIDSSGNVYVTGNFRGTASFGGGISLTSSGNSNGDAFIAKLDTSGNTLWARHIVASEGSYGRGVGTDTGGNVYVTGSFSGTDDFGGISVTSKTNGFVTRLDATGNFLWAEDTSTGAGGGIAVDGSGHVYVTTGGGVSRLDAATGSFIWTDQLVGGGSIALDGAGNVYTTGGFQGSADFDPGPGTFTFTLSASDQGEAFVSVLDPNGHFLAAWQAVAARVPNATEANSFGTGIAADTTGDVWVFGENLGAITLPTGQTLSSPNANPNGQNSAVFLMRLSAPHGAVLGTVYSDLNGNGTRDSGEPALAGWTVYADLNGNGVLDPGEPSATTDANGNYEIDNLAPGTYTIRPVLPSGWAVSAPAGGVAPVPVGSGFAQNIDFGADKPTGTATLVLSGFPSTVMAGAVGSLTITAKDASGNVTPNYTGTVHFSSSDGQASLPADYTFTSADAGSHTFSIALKTAGTQALTATDTATSTITGSQKGITVNPAPASTLAVSGFPSPTTVGVAGNATVMARDPYGNTAAATSAPSISPAATARRSCRPITPSPAPMPAVTPSASR
jgi:hypothetical protein